MPRQPRYVLPGQPQHVTIRGVDRNPIYYQTADYRYYRSRLHAALVKHDCELHAYVLMTNHVHLLITPNSVEGIGKAVQMLGRYYVQYFNRRYGRTGTLWEGRYKAAPVDSEHYLMTCYRYIELNPVRAHMVPQPADYPWSSYRHNAFGDIDELLTPHQKYIEIGQSDDLRQRAYRGLFNSPISPAQMDEIRDASNRDWVLGSEYFKQKIEQKLKRRASPAPRGGDRKSKQFQAR